MCKNSFLIRALFVIAVGLGCALWAPQVHGQSEGRERPKLKDFGSSLDRLKWDESKRAAVDKKARKEKEQKHGQAEEDEEVVRVETSLVVCDVLVLDRQGRMVHGLTREDFLVTEDGRPQEVGTFSLGDDARVPRTIVLIIDYSGSQLPFIKMSVEAAKTLVDRLGPRDLMAIVTDDVELLADFTADKVKLKKKLDVLTQRATDDKGFLSQAFGRGRRVGRSAQYSALMATLKESFDEEDVRPVVIFQTDGDEIGYLRDPVWEPVVPPNLPPDMHTEAVEAVQRAQKRMDDNRREFSLRDVYTAAEKARATIYTVVPGYRLVGLTYEEQLKQSEASRERFRSTWRLPAELQRGMEERYRRTPPEAVKSNIEQASKVQQALVDLSTLTGGWADFLEEPTQAAGIYERIFSDVNRRYIVGFYPTNKARDGGRRRVSIEVRGHPEYTVWGRKSYYAPGPDE
jgi:VWFA-related protein